MTRVLVLAAHPDDEVLGMGGTIAVHADRGDEVRIVVVTDGSSTQYPGDAEIRARRIDTRHRIAVTFAAYEAANVTGVPIEDKDPDAYIKDNS